MASAEERLADLKAQRPRAHAKLNARTGQPGYGANVEMLKQQIADLDNQIAELEVELAAQAAEEQTDGQGGPTNGL